MPWQFAEAMRPSCLGIINTSIGLTASFSSQMTEINQFNPGSVSIVGQSGSIAVNAHARARELGLGFHLTIGCGNEAALGIPDFMHALLEDEGTRVIAMYSEAITDPADFVAALAEGRRGGGANLSSCWRAEQRRQAGAPCGLTRAGSPAAIAPMMNLPRVRGNPDSFSGRPAGSCIADRILATRHAALGQSRLISTFGGGSGVIATDQCGREGLVVPQLGCADTRAARAGVRQHIRDHASQSHAPRPVGLSWLSPPQGIIPRLAASGAMVFTEHALG
jgi:hypothetical protein